MGLSISRLSKWCGDHSFIENCLTLFWSQNFNGINVMEKCAQEGLKRSTLEINLIRRVL